MAVSNLAYSNSQACDICNITTYLVLLRILLQLHESTPFLATTQKLIYIKALCRGGGLSNNQNIVHLPRVDRDHQGVQRIVRPTSGSEPIREPEEISLEDGVQHHDGGALDDLVFQGGDRQRPLPSVRLRNIRPAGRLRPVGPSVNTVVQSLKPKLKACLVFLPCHPIHARVRLALERVECGLKCIDADMVEKRREPLLLPQPCGLPYAVQRLCHACPDLRPARALLSRVPLGPRPSLHRLRHGRGRFVRRLHRYYGRV